MTAGSFVLVDSRAAEAELDGVVPFGAPFDAPLEGLMNAGLALPGRRVILPARRSRIALTSSSETFCAVHRTYIKLASNRIKQKQTHEQEVQKISSFGSSLFPGPSLAHFLCFFPDLGLKHIRVVEQPLRITPLRRICLSLPDSPLQCPDAHVWSETRSGFRCVTEPSALLLIHYEF